MEAIRFLCSVFVSGQPFVAGQTAEVGTDISAEEARKMVRLARAEPAASAAKPSPRKRVKPTDTPPTDSEPTP